MINNTEKQIKVYVASPFLAQKKHHMAVRQQIDAGNILMNHGYFPYVPLLTMFQDIIHPRSEEDWLALDFCWLKQCDIMIRIHPKNAFGQEIPSRGADMEEEIAIKNNIPVYHFDTLKEIEEYFKLSAIKNKETYKNKK